MDLERNITYSSSSLSGCKVLVCKKVVELMLLPGLSEMQKKKLKTLKAKIRGNFFDSNHPGGVWAKMGRVGASSSVPDRRGEWSKRADTILSNVRPCWWDKSVGCRSFPSSLFSLWHCPSFYLSLSLSLLLSLSLALSPSLSFSLSLSLSPSVPLCVSQISSNLHVWLPYDPAC